MQPATVVQNNCFIQNEHLFIIKYVYKKIKVSYKLILHTHTLIVITNFFL